MVWSRRLSLALLALLVCHQATAGTILLEFTSPSCGPCRAMRPVMRQLAALKYDVREVDTSQEPGLSIAKQYRVIDLPTFVVLVDGRERARLVGGGNSTAKLVEMIHKATALAAPKAAIEVAGAPSVFVGDDAARGPMSTPQGTFQPGRVVPIDQEPPVSRTRPREQAGVSASADALIAATVRISIDDPEGKSTGTGTIIDARNDKALVLTCGHLFRTSGGKGPIEVSLFAPGPNGAELRKTVEGTLIDYDLERDLALVCFVPDGAVTVAPVAPAGTQMAVDQPATSVGCAHGANPTPWATQITAIDRYQGPPNIEAAKAPVEGRSGGGLFNAAGQLVGVCNAADPQLDEGLYASLPSIHAKLDALQIGFVYQSPSSGGGQPSASSPSTALAAMESPFKVRGQNPTPDAPPSFPTVLPNPLDREPDEAASEPAPAAATAEAPAFESALSPEEQALLQEISRRGSDSEVICIVRPREPGGRSEVIKLDRASPAFVRALGGAQPTVAATAGAQALAPAGQPLVR